MAPRICPPGPELGSEAPEKQANSPRNGGPRRGDPSATASWSPASGACADDRLASLHETCCPGHRRAPKSAPAQMAPGDDITSLETLCVQAHEPTAEGPACQDGLQAWTSLSSLLDVIVMPGSGRAREPASCMDGPRPPCLTAEGVQGRARHGAHTPFPGRLHRGQRGQLHTLGRLLTKAGW